MGGGGSNAQGEGWSRTTPGFTRELGSVLSANMQGTTGFGKQDALNDVQGVIRQNAINTMQESLPKIASGEKLSGAYGSTTRTMMNNDLQARIAGQMAATQVEAIRNYAQIDADRIRAFAAATQAGTATASEQFSSSSSRNASPWGSALGNLAGAAVGGGLDYITGGSGGGDGGHNLMPDSTKEQAQSPLGQFNLQPYQAFANGGVVPDARKSAADRAIEMLGQEQLVNSYAPGRVQEKKVEYRQQSALPSSMTSEAPATTKKAAGLEDDDEFFRMLGV